ncbi:MAG: hypothetical protein ACLFS6_09935 [Methanomassiliicoccales archaeon]
MKLPKVLSMAVLLLLASLTLLPFVGSGMGPVDGVGPDQAGPPEGVGPPGEGMEFRPFSEDDGMEALHMIMEKGSDRGLFGPMNYAQGRADGSFVHFSVDERAGTIAGYSLEVEQDDVEFFDGIDLGEGDLELRSMGSVVSLSGSGMEAVLHDTPNGQAKVISHSQSTVTFTLADGVMVESCYDPKGRLMEDSVKLVADGAYGLLRVQGGTLEAGEGTVSASLDEGQVSFRCRPADPSPVQDLIIDEMARGHVGGEMTFMVQNGSGVTSRVTYQAGFAMEMVEMERERVSLQVSSEDPEGKVIMLRWDKGSLDSEDGLNVEMDDHTMEEGDPFTAVEQGDEDPCYSLIDGGITSQLLIYIPHFSVHSIGVESISKGLILDEYDWFGIIIGFALVSIAGLKVFKK